MLWNEVLLQISKDVQADGFVLPADPLRGEDVVHEFGK
jgi:hypothetical protein